MCIRDSHWTINSCVGVFLSVWVYLEPFCYCTKLAAKHAKLVQLMQKFVPWYLVRIFATNAPDPHHWNLNSCFGALLSIWVHLEPFRYCMKLAAKHAKLVQLMQKFVPRCLVRNFHNKRSRSTPLESKLMFWCVSFRSGAFWTVSLLHETWCKSAKLVQLKQKFMPQSRVRIFRYECTRSTPLDSKLIFVALRKVWMHLRSFRYSTKLGEKWAELVPLLQKFMPRSRVGTLRYERARSTPLDSKLIFCCISYS